jgi:bifunctional DNA-binding transcriptional regulator/antitoxin component of YhaV-PrlF toxin-antitoxin module
MTKTWTLEVKKMMVTDDYYVEFPEEVLEEAGWKPGDTLKWTDRGDGSWSLAKINENTEDNPDEK